MSFLRNRISQLISESVPDRDDGTDNIAPLDLALASGPDDGADIIDSLPVDNVSLVSEFVRIMKAAKCTKT